MSLKNQVIAQAKLLAGELDVRDAALLEVLCSAASDSLAARLREAMQPEDCEGAFVTAASLYALCNLQDAEKSASLEEFKAGDLTVKHSKPEVQNLRKQADQVIAPFLKDSFRFSGV